MTINKINVKIYVGIKFYAGGFFVTKIFEGLFGNEPTKLRFSSAIRNGTLAHAFLIDGPAGSGKRTLAIEIAAALNCENKSDGTYALPCRSCNTCRRIFGGSYTDIKELDLKGGKASIGVGDVKDFKDDMFLSATESDFKIYIINNAHTLTAQAQNALLTVMEEPPSGVVIMLLSASSDKILTTIKSRTQYTAMQIFSPAELENYLTETMPEARSLKFSERERLSAIIMRSNGCIGQAKSLMNAKSAEEAEKERQNVKRVVKALDIRASYSELYSALSALPSLRPELLRALEEVICAVSDMIKAKCSGENAPTVFFENAAEARSYAAPLSQGRLFRVSALLCEYHSYLAKNASVAAVTASLATKIKLI